MPRIFFILFIFYIHDSKGITRDQRQMIFSKKIKRLYEKPINGCDFYRKQSDELFEFKRKYGLKFPKGITEVKINEKNIDGIKKFKGLEDRDCFFNLIIDMKCEDIANSIYKIKSDSISQDVTSEFRDLYSNKRKKCMSVGDELILDRLEPMLKSIVEDSMENAYKALKVKLSSSINKSDHRPLYTEVRKLAAKIGRPDLVEEVTRMPMQLSFPSDRDVDNLLKERRESCKKKDNTDVYVRRDYYQADTNACFAFGAANLINYHLGIQEVSPLFLFTLAVAKKDAAWYHLQDVYASSNVDYNGGFPSGAIQEALKLGRVCLKSDLFDPRTGNGNLASIVKEAEFEGELGIELISSYKKKEITKSKLIEELKQIFNAEDSGTKKAFPKAVFQEFASALRSTDDPVKYFQNMLLSQCKTKLSKEQRDLQINTKYSFGPKSLSSRDFDQVIDSDSIAALGLHSGYVLEGDIYSHWKPHIVTLTGRRWNQFSNTCEFRIVNSWGGECRGINHKDVSCGDDGLWINESYLIEFGNSLTTITKSPRMIEKKLEKLPNYEPYDEDF